MKVMTQRWIEKAEKDFKICARNKKYYKHFEYAFKISYPRVCATKEEAEESFAICQSLRNLVRKYFGLEVVG